MYKIAVIGDADSICGFAAVGVTVVPVKDADEAYGKMCELASSDYGMIFVTENVYGRISEEYVRIDALPAIIPIPGSSGNTGVGMRDVSKFVEMAVGSDIIS